MPVLVRKSWPQSASVISILMGGGLIRKSQGLWHEDDRDFHGFGPKELFDGRDDHPYDDSEHLGLKPHHTPFGYRTNPETGKKELRFDEDGKTPFGFHAIDGVANDLFGKMRDAGWDTKAVSPKVMIQRAIDAFNEHHLLPDGSPGPHSLPGFDSVKWRRIFAGPYQGGQNAKMHSRELQTHGVGQLDEDGNPVRGGYRPMQTVNLNKGNVNKPGAATGAFFDSGFVPFYRELGALMKRENEKQMAGGKESLKLDEMEYLSNPAIYPRKMSHGKVSRLKDAPYMAATGRRYGQEISDSPHANVNSYSVTAAGIPQAFTSTVKNANGDFVSRGGSPVEIDDAGIHQTGVRSKAMKAFKAANLSLSDEELARWFAMPLSMLLFGRAKGVPETILHGLGAEHGIDFDGSHGSGSSHPEYQRHFASMNAGKPKTEEHKPRGSHKLAQKLAALSRTVGHNELMDSDYQYIDRYGNEYETEIEDIILANKVLTALTKHHGIEAHDYGAELLSSEGHEMENRHHELPEHYDEHVALSSQHMTPPHQSQRPSHPQEELPSDEPSGWKTQAPLSEPPRFATARERALRERRHEMATVPVTEGGMLGGQFQGRTVTPSRAAYIQEQSLPYHTTGYTEGLGPDATYTPTAQVPSRQTFFSPEGQWLKSRDDVRDAMDSVLKAMEDLQLTQAVEDVAVMKHVPSRIDTQCNSDIGTFAKSLGLTGHDVRAIHSAQGDWSKVAKQWSVNETTVKVIKATMRGSLS